MYVGMYMYTTVELDGVPQLQNVLGWEQESDQWVSLVLRMISLFSSGLER